MRQYILLALLAVPLFGQDAWHRAAMSFPERPGSGVTLQDVNRLDETARLALPYFAAFTPVDYEANRALVRRMANYLAMVDAVNHDPQIRLALGRAYRSVAALEWMAMANYAPRQQPPPPQNERPSAPSQPAFAIQAPLIERIPQAEQATANELSTQYEMAAAKASIAWNSAGLIRRNLNGQGLSLNAATETSLARIHLYFDLASAALQAKDWGEAKTNINRAVYETEKVLKTVGR